MATFTQSLMGLVTPDLISKASSLLGENEAKVEVAAKSTLSTILGGVLNKGNDSTLETLFLNASDNDLLSNVTSFFSGPLDEKIKNMGKEFVSSLFGDKAGDVVNLIATQSGISKENSGKLMSMLSPLVAGFVGNKLKSGLGFSSLLGSIAGDKDQFLNLIPKDLTNVLDIPSLSGLGANFLKDIPQSAASFTPEVKKAFPWLKVLVPAGLALLGLFFMMGRDKAPNQVVQNSGGTVVEATKTSVETAINTTLDDAERISTNISDKIDGTVGETIDGANAVMSNLGDKVDASLEKIQNWIDIKLPDGSILQGFKFGIEERMLEFLQSDEYVLMANDELKKHWFDFDNINFEFGSGTEITKESELQIKNIASVLANFSDSSVKIGAYTDKKGDDALNIKLSQERAETVKQLLIEAGVPGSRITGAEGYGSQFATVSADASDEERAKDRRVAIRFERQE